MAYDAADEIHATVTKIEAAAGPQWPFVASAQTSGGPVRIFLREKPFKAIKPGDELIFLAAALHYPSPDGVPSITPHPDARNSVFSTLMSSDGAVYRSASKRDSGVREFGITDAMLWAKRMSMASSALKSPGVTVLRRPDAEKEGDPIIKWVVSRFNDPTIAHLRNAADLIVQPETVNASENTFRRNMYPAIPSELVATTLLPGYLLHDKNVARKTVEAGMGFQATAIIPGKWVNQESVGLVFPYSLRETSLDQLYGLSRWPTHNGLPRQMICARSRFMLTAAHEMAHLLSTNIEERLPPSAGKSDSALVQRSEAFADSLAILMFVTDTGAAKDATKLANIRSIATLVGGGETHYTGRACHDAVSRAVALHAKFSGRPVPMAVLVAAAVEIALDNQIAPVEDYRFVNSTLNELDPAWESRDAQSIANLVGRAVEIAAPKLQDVRKISRDIVGGLKALHTMFDLSPAISLKQHQERMAHLASQDIADHYAECLSVAGTAATREVLGDLAARSRTLTDQFYREFNLGKNGGLAAWLKPGTPVSPTSWPREILEVAERQVLLPQAQYLAAARLRAEKAYALGVGHTGPGRPMFIATRRPENPSAISSFNVEI